MSKLAGVGAVFLAATMVAIAAVASNAGTTQNYLVVYKASAVPADAATTIQKAGGALVYSYPEIGVAVASSGSESFRDALLKDAKVDNASATGAFSYRLPASDVSAGDASGPPPGYSISPPGPLSACCPRGDSLDPMLTQGVVRSGPARPSSAG